MSGVSRFALAPGQKALNLALRGYPLIDLPFPSNQDPIGWHHAGSAFTHLTSVNHKNQKWKSVPNWLSWNSELKRLPAPGESVRFILICPGEHMIYPG